MNAIVKYQGAPIATTAEVVAHTLRVQEILKSVMKQDVHYGIIPGTKKNTLYKPGAEILCVTFHIAPTYDVVEDRFPDGVRFRVTCAGVHQGTGAIVATGLGSCSSHEEKYKWGTTYKKEFDATPVDRRRIQWGWNKSERKEFEILQVRVETADIENTLLKMACKRALIAMTLNALAVSDLFAQDLEDLSKKVIDMMEGDDADDAEKTAREPVKSKSQAAPPKDVDPATGEVTAAQPKAPLEPGTAADPKTSPPAPAGMIKLIKAKAAAAGVNIDEALAKAGTTFESLSVAQGNAMLKVISETVAA